MRMPNYNVTEDESFLSLTSCGKVARKWSAMTRSERTIFLKLADIVLKDDHTLDDWHKEGMSQSEHADHYMYICMKQIQLGLMKAMAVVANFDNPDYECDNDGAIRGIITEAWDAPLLVLLNAHGGHDVRPDDCVTESTSAES